MQYQVCRKLQHESESKRRWPRCGFPLLMNAVLLVCYCCCLACDIYINRKKPINVNFSIYCACRVPHAVAAHSKYSHVHWEWRRDGVGGQ
jgi:hypothetical protein